MLFYPLKIKAFIFLFLAGRRPAKTLSSDFWGTYTLHQILRRARKNNELHQRASEINVLHSSIHLLHQILQTARKNKLVSRSGEDRKIRSHFIQRGRRWQMWHATIKIKYFQFSQQISSPLVHTHHLSAVSSRCYIE